MELTDQEKIQTLGGSETKSLHLYAFAFVCFTIVSGCVYSAWNEHKLWYKRLYGERLEQERNLIEKIKINKNQYSRAHRTLNEDIAIKTGIENQIQWTQSLLAKANPIKYLEEEKSKFYEPYVKTKKEYIQLAQKIYDQCASNKSPLSRDDIENIMVREQEYDYLPIEVNKKLTVLPGSPIHNDFLKLKKTHKELEKFFRKFSSVEEELKQAKTKNSPEKLFIDYYDRISSLQANVQKHEKSIFQHQDNLTEIKKISLELEKELKGLQDTIHRHSVKAKLLRTCTAIALTSAFAIIYKSACNSVHNKAKKSLFIQSSYKFYTLTAAAFAILSCGLYLKYLQYKKQYSKVLENKNLCIKEIATKTETMHGVEGNRKGSLHTIALTKDAIKELNQLKESDQALLDHITQEPKKIYLSSRERFIRKVNQYQKAFDKDIAILKKLEEYAPNEKKDKSSLVKKVVTQFTKQELIDKFSNINIQEALPIVKAVKNICPTEYLVPEGPTKSSSLEALYDVLEASARQQKTYKDYSDTYALRYNPISASLRKTFFDKINMEIKAHEDCITMHTNRLSPGGSYDMEFTARKAKLREAEKNFETANTLTFEQASHVSAYWRHFKDATALTLLLTSYAIVCKHIMVKPAKNQIEAA